MLGVLLYLYQVGFLAVLEEVGAGCGHHHTRHAAFRRLAQVYVPPTVYLQVADVEAVVEGLLNLVEVLRVGGGRDAAADDEKQEGDFEDVAKDRCYLFHDGIFFDGDYSPS